jgi:tetratricopeptide (TPR) repeat protein
MKRFKKLPLACLMALCAGLLIPVTTTAQEAGGDLGGGAGIFRPKNPETTSRRRTTPGTRPTTNRPSTTRPPRNTGTGRPAAPPPEVIEERYEDALDEGNEARDARKYVEAEKAYRDAGTVKPKDWRAWYGLGNVYTDQGRWDVAEKAYQQASQYGNLNPDIFIALSFVMIQPRPDGASAKRLADAELAARRAIQIQASNAVAHDRLGAALEARGSSVADAEQAYRRAIELDSQYAVAHVHLARLLRKTKRASEAEPLYARAIELANNAPTLSLIAESLQAEQRWDDSEPVLRRALQMDANSPTALYLLGRMLIVKKRYDEGEQALKRTIEISPRSFLPYNVLGSAYLRMERIEDAEKIYNRAAELASAGERMQLAGAFGFEGVGDGYVKMSRTADALRAYQRGLQLDPSNSSLQAKITRTRSGG